MKRELLALLGRTGECDLGTIYRSILGLLGSEFAAEIGVHLGRLIRVGTIEIETSCASVDGPLVGIVRLLPRSQLRDDPSVDPTIVDREHDAKTQKVNS